MSLAGEKPHWSILKAAKIFDEVTGDPHHKDRSAFCVAISRELIAIDDERTLWKNEAVAARKFIRAMTELDGAPADLQHDSESIQYHAARIATLKYFGEF